MSEVAHIVVSTDETVRRSRGLVRGTVARCSCGWKSEWGVRDGSAEADGYYHMVNNDQAYREQEQERARQWQEHHAALPKVASAPKPVKSTHSHNCSCHLSAPCGACENCKHFDEPECVNDCQDCDEHEEDL